MEKSSHIIPQHLRLTGVLFDLDGVLVDSESTYTEFWAGIDKIYPTGITDFAHAIKGTTLSHILTLFPTEEIRSDVSRRIHEFEQTMEYPLYPGVNDFLAQLQEMEIPSAIVTSSDKVKMGYLLKQHPRFRSLFSAVIDGSIVTRSKPDPQGYLLAAEAIGRDIRDCFVFEDSLQGLEAGMRSGATVIGLSTTNPRELLKGKAHKLIDGFTGFSVSDMLAVSRP